MGTNAAEDIERKIEWQGKIFNNWDELNDYRHAEATIKWAVGDKLFDTLFEAESYKNKNNIKAWTYSGIPCAFDSDMAGFILTTNIEQNKYAYEKGISLNGTYGIYYFDERSKIWCRVPTEVVEEICRRFK